MQSTQQITNKQIMRMHQIIKYNKKQITHITMIITIINLYQFLTNYLPVIKTSQIKQPQQKI